MKIVSSCEVAHLVEDGQRVVLGGFGSCGHPGSLTNAISRRHTATGHRPPCFTTASICSVIRQQTWLGLDRLAKDGLVSEAIGGFWGLCPELGRMAQSGKIATHFWPQGVISSLFSEIAASRPGLITSVGIGTFVDPRNDGGVLDRSTTQPIVELLKIGQREFLFYPAMPIDFALLRGTSSDEHGNIYFDEEISYMDALAQATATKNSGGTVVVQVKRLTDHTTRKPSEVRIPGILVNFVVLSDEAEHPQTYGCEMEQSFLSGPARADLTYMDGSTGSLAENLIADRAARELLPLGRCHANLGIGIPAMIAWTEIFSKVDGITLTVEASQVGGRPAGGLSFGASSGRLSVIEQASMFDLYDGGGIDIAFLGCAEVDSCGNVNVSRFSDRLQGAGGFINITQAAQRLVFCGTLTANGLSVVVRSGKLQIISEGNTKKFVRKLGHLTFNAKIHRAQSVKYITERCVFELIDGSLILSKLADGITVDDIATQLRWIFPSHRTSNNTSLRHSNITDYQRSDEDIVMRSSIAIIGTGAASLAVLHAYAQRFEREIGLPNSIFCFEQSGVFGPGEAYCDDSQVCLLNTKTGFISPYVGRAGIFSRWLSNNPDLWKELFPNFVPDDEGYAPRSLFGLFMRHEFTTLVKYCASKGLNVTQLQAEAIVLPCDGFHCLQPFRARRACFPHVRYGTRR
ncbi:Acetyl-CoA:acetoacetyl-CoA transferase, alpha subunit [Candidatus Burkholderia humilis]|nr:Acetyl-CoA:acetoacetyl-CoA transferase, alpha subunit [Candidatus Burkholderia humilis]